MKRWMKTVVVAMSGGVDSSVAAALLKEQGYEVIGITMHLWDFNRVGGDVHRENTCCSPEAMNDARSVCHQLGISHYVVDFREEFEESVIRNFIDDYMAGRTPNPCILCNTQMKWGYLLTKAQQLGAYYLATGHYARVCLDEESGRYFMKRGRDQAKEQSYALWGLSQRNLQRTLLPLGELYKEEVRKIAHELGLKTAEKDESQEICFIVDNNYHRFLCERIAHFEDRIKEGEIVNQKGEILGTHRGYPFYTIGQRRGLGIALGKPLYVTKIDPASNKIYVGTKDELLADGLVATDLNWIAIERLEKPMEVVAKIRYNDPGGEATIFPINGKVRVKFKRPQWAVTPGQSVVFYQGDLVVGGGIIVGKFGSGANEQC